MRVLIVDNSDDAHAGIASKLSAAMASDPSVETRLCDCEEIHLCLEFQPSVVLFTAEPLGTPGDQALTTLHSLLPGSLLVLYLAQDRFYVDASTFTKSWSPRHERARASVQPHPRADPCDTNPDLVPHPA